jgi:branched-chain amino acid aminotransferase
MLYFSRNGNLFPETESPDRSSRFGDGVFETIAIIQGKPLWFDAHFYRLLKAIRFIQLELPDYWNENWLENQIADLLQINQIKHGRIRIQVSRAGKGAFTPETDEAVTVIETFSDEKVWKQTSKRVVGIFDSVLLHKGALSEFKTCNSLPYILAARFAAKNHWDDVLLLSQDQSIAECSASNVFAVINEQWFTPSLASGCLPGIFRQKLITFLQKNNIPITENTWHLSWLKSEPQELYSVSSVQGLCPIISIRGHNRTFAAFKSESSLLVQQYFNQELGV